MSWPFFNSKRIFRLYPGYLAFTGKRHTLLSLCVPHPSLRSPWTSAVQTRPNTLVPDPHFSVVGSERDTENRHAFLRNPLAGSEKPVIREPSLRRRNRSVGSYVPLPARTPKTGLLFISVCQSPSGKRSAFCFVLFRAYIFRRKSTGKSPFPVGFSRIPVPAMQKRIPCRQVHRRRNRFAGSYLPQPGSDSQNRPSFHFLCTGARPKKDRPRN